MIRECHTKILDVLKSRGLISSSTKKLISGFIMKWQVDVVRALIETHIFDESKLADVLADEMKIPRISGVRSVVISDEVLACIPFEVALESVVIPFEMSEQGFLRIIVANPFDSEKILELERLSKRKVEIFVAERSEIIGLIQRLYPLNLQLPSLMNMATPPRDLYVEEV